MLPALLGLVLACMLGIVWLRLCIGLFVGGILVVWLQVGGTCRFVCFILTCCVLVGCLRWVLFFCGGAWWFVFVMWIGVLLCWYVA